MRTLKTTILAGAIGLLGAGCGFIANPDSRHDGLSPSDDLVHDGGGDMICEYPPVLSGAHHAVDLRDCVKLEGAELGDDVTVEVNGEAVTISDWENKDGEGEYVGFHIEGDVIVVVKAGNDLHESRAGDWVHPAGTSGPRAKGISFVAFCEPPSDEPVCRPTDGGDPSGGDGPGSDGPGGEPGGYCDPYTCEPGGGSYPEIDDGDGSGGDGSGGDGSGGDGSGGDGSGGDGSCAVTACGADSLCPDQHACFSGCCLEVVL